MVKQPTLSDENHPLEYACITTSVDLDVLKHYGDELSLAQPEHALKALAEAVAVSATWRNMPKASIVIRMAPQPVLAVFGHFNTAEIALLNSQTQRLNNICKRFRFISHARAEQDCEELAELLVKRFGRGELSKFSYTAIPRGGLIVLCMLAYILDLKPVQLTPPYPIGAPLVVVDDCALSGARFNRFLRNCEIPQVIFAHLYSHPNLRKAIEIQETRVLACLSALDLHENSTPIPELDEHTWRKQLLLELGGDGYWIGQTEHVCFAWNEPDRTIYNWKEHKLTDPWRIVPPQYCLKNRLPSETKPVPVQVQPAGKDPLKPADEVIFCDLEKEILAQHIPTGQSFGMQGIAADIWRGIIEFGNLSEVLDTLLDKYEVQADVLRADLHGFVEKLLAKGLLQHIAQE